MRETQKDVVREMFHRGWIWANRNHDQSYASCLFTGILGFFPDGHSISPTLWIYPLLNQPHGRLRLFFQRERGIQHRRQVLNQLFRTFKIRQV